MYLDIFSLIPFEIRVKDWGWRFIKIYLMFFFIFKQNSSYLGSSCIDPNLKGCLSVFIMMKNLSLAFELNKWDPFYFKEEKYLKSKKKEERSPEGLRARISRVGFSVTGPFPLPLVNLRGAWFDPEQAYLLDPFFTIFFKRPPI